MSYRSDAATERVYLSATLPNPATTGLTVMGWFRIRVDRNDFSTYWRTSTGGATIHTCATDTTGVGVNLFTASGSLVDTYINAVDEWVHIAVTDNNGTVTQYVTPDGGTITSQSGSVGTGTPDQICIAGRHSGDASEWFNGGSANVRVFADVLTQTEIETERDSAEAVLTAWSDWPLSTGTDLNDVSGNGRHLTAVGAGGTTEEDPPISSTVIGSGVALLGALTGTASGTRTVNGTAAAAFGGLAGTASGVRTVLATAAAALGVLAGTATGTRTVLGAATGGLGTLAGTASGQRTVFGTGSGSLGGLLGVGSGTGGTGQENPSTGNWDTLLAIIREAQQLAEAELSRPPTACPNDGEPLRSHRGVLHCASDGWTYP